MDTWLSLKQRLEEMKSYKPGFLGEVDKNLNLDNSILISIYTR